MKSINRFPFFLCLLTFTFSGCQKHNDPKPPVADAGNSQTIQLPVNTATLTGSGTTTNGSITGYLWILVSGPNVPVISQPGSASTNVSGMIEGTYHFQFKVTDNAGLTGIDTTSIIVNAAPNPPIADAGNSQTIQLPVNNATLTGTGTTTNGNITGYLWSLISGPNIPVIAQPASASTNVTGMIAGTYYFQFKVTDNIGLIGLDTTSVIVNPPPPQTLTLQPSNNTSNELNFAVTGSQNVSSHDKDLDAGAWTSGGLNTYLRGAFKFDLSSIPVNATIISAKLTLYSIPDPTNGDLVNANSGSNNAMYIRRIIGNWDGSTATWQTQPATTATDQILIPHTNQPFLDLIDLDVKTLIDAMRTNGNYGFMLNLQNETAYTIRQFCSSFHSNAAKHPKLVIVYQ
jgi:hypothetical protein